MEEFTLQDLRKLFRPHRDSIKGENGRVTIIGGSSLFHGAPILALKVASRIVDMVFFSSPEPSIELVVAQMKSKLSAFIWVPFKEIEDYINSSDAILIGPGFMRYRKENFKKRSEANKVSDRVGWETKKITETLLKKFPQKQWVIDGGSLQVMNPYLIPPGAILTPNQKEFKMLFGEEKSEIVAKRFQCIVILKAPQTLVLAPEKCVLINGGNPGLTKGGTGDVLAGLTVGLAAKNEPFLAACAASWIWKKTADELYQRVGFSYSADDLAEKIPEILGQFWR